MKQITAAFFLLLAYQMAAAQQAQTTSQLNPVKVNGKWGYADKTGKVVIQPQFDTAFDFWDGLAQVGVKDKDFPETVNPSYKMGFIDESGRIVVELKFASLRNFHEGLAAAAVTIPDDGEKKSYKNQPPFNFKWGYIDLKGQTVIPMEFIQAGDFSENLASVQVAESSKSLCGNRIKFGYIDKTGAVVIEPKFVRADRFHNGRAEVAVGRVCYVGRCLCCNPRFFGSYGHIDKKGVFTNDMPNDKGDSLKYAPCEDN